jgi:hypothetical protein
VHEARTEYWWRQHSNLSIPGCPRYAWLGHTDRFSKIERDNRLLLNKMSLIMQKNTLDNRNQSWRYARSLNKSYRKKELERITLENQVSYHV